MLARELAALEEQYQDLVNAVSNGVMTMEQAMHTLDNMVATDADGRLWRLDLEGRFLAGLPGEVPQLIDPQRFTVHSPGPWEGGWSAADSTPYTSGIPSAPSGIAAAPVGLPSPSTPRRRSKNTPRVDVGALLGRLGGWGRLRTPLIVGLAAVAAFMIWTGDSQSPDGTPIPVENTGQSQATGGATESAEPEGVSYTEAAKGTTGPAAQVDKLLAALSNPERDVRELVADPGSGDKLLLRRAQFAGYRAVGLQLVVTTLTETPDGYQASIALRDGEGHDIIAGKVSVIADGDRLILAGWPEFGR